MGRCEFHMPLTELELLGSMIRQLLLFAEKPVRHCAGYHRVRMANGSFALVRVDCAVNTNLLGRSVSFRNTYTPVMIAEFDAALERNPEQVRPLMVLMGDMRRGKELLSDGPRDHALYKMSTLAQTPEGRQLLARFAAVRGG